MSHAYYRTEDDTLISVIIRDRTVNVSATSEMNIKDFISLAKSVVAAYNDQNDTHDGFVPYVNALEDWKWRK